MKVSLIISTYNRPDALRLCLLSVLAQKRLPDEIIVGDDGSGAPTRELIRSMQKLSPVPLIHVWHEDKGFRLAAMRNKSVARAKGDYIVEIDGDLILHPNFIKDHENFARQGCYLKGGRTNLGKELTERLCREGRLRHITPFTKGIESKPENALRFPLLGKFLAGRYRKKRGMFLGCNMSFFRDDFLAVNGYDEFFEGWGGEDGDFARRLRLHGLKKRHLKFVGLVSHLWHEDKYMYNKDRNYIYSMRADASARCGDGIDKYLN